MAQSLSNTYGLPAPQGMEAKFDGYTDIPVLKYYLADQSKAKVAARKLLRPFKPSLWGVPHSRETNAK
jgi:hypothetical protein